MYHCRKYEISRNLSETAVRTDIKSGIFVIGFKLHILEIKLKKERSSSEQNKKPYNFLAYDL